MRTPSGAASTGGGSAASSARILSSTRLPDTAMGTSDPSGEETLLATRGWPRGNASKKRETWSHRLDLRVTEFARIAKHHCIQCAGESLLDVQVSVLRL